MGYAEPEIRNLTAGEILDELEERYPEGNFNPEIDLDAQKLVGEFLEKLDVDAENRGAFYTVAQEGDYDTMREVIDR